MPLRVRTISGISAHALRDALVENLEEIAGDYRLLEAALPYPGAPLLLDAGQRPLLLSYDAEDGTRALLQGLDAAEQLRGDAGWLARLHPSIPAARWNEFASLAVVGPNPPVGANLIRTPMRLMLFTYRMLSVNGDTGILLEAVGGASPERAPVADAPAPAAAPKVAGKLGLTAEESAFFADLLEN